MAIRYLIGACIMTVPLASCSSEEAPVEQTEIAPVAENPNLTEITDRGGSVLRVDCQGFRPDLTLEAPALGNMFVPVKIRFQSAEADEYFRSRIEMDVDEADYWTYDEDIGRYEVGWPIAFMDAMAKADRVFLELAPEDGTPTAMVFDITERDQINIKDCSDRNVERVDQEMRRLGLGKYDTSPKLPAHPIPAVDVAGLLALYDEFALAVDRANKLLAPELSEKHEEAMTGLQTEGLEKGTPYSTVMEYFFTEFSSNTGALNSFVSDYGFEGNDQWLKVGDRYYLGLEAMKLERANPGWVETHRYISGREWAAMTGKEKAVAGMLASMSDWEVEYFSQISD